LLLFLFFVAVSYAKGDRVWYYKTPMNDDGSFPEKTTFESVEEASQHGAEVIPADILAVHHDDFPNIYYSVRLLNESKNEKQTDAKHLIPSAPTSNANSNNNSNTSSHRNSPAFSSTVKPSSSSLSSSSSGLSFEEFQNQLLQLGGHVLTLKLSYKNKELPSAVRVSSHVTILQLKSLIHYLIPQIRVKDMKLICKGLFLKDDKMTLSKTGKVTDGSKITVMGSETV
jgi:hypothetical protein